MIWNLELDIPILIWNFPRLFRDFRVISALFPRFPRYFLGLEMGFPAFERERVIFKRGLERNCKSKNVLEFDVIKDDGIIF